ncbi:LOW QUALITY PROTEIN: hypothetical protein BC938DRAFT_482598 [Jimgerdemannia flammicorona]|uniref:Amino acid transporter transmembrane domain-containing protein n=1 Tax=Jimgerdemannia flammicorona TaxID=994334 RepID=A0A433QDK1_9FUNG|nr:LOW QUALITY PROTEIN: hypothetical protein BC938DRAFT_482598 [Jimgerdemannia flammicorona]
MNLRDVLKGTIAELTVDRVLNANTSLLYCSLQSDNQRSTCLCTFCAREVLERSCYYEIFQRSNKYARSSNWWVFNQHHSHEFVIWHQFPIVLSSLLLRRQCRQSARRGLDTKPEGLEQVVAARLSTCAALNFLTAIPIYNNFLSGIPKTATIVVITAHVLLVVPILMTSFAFEVEEPHPQNRVYFESHLPRYHRRLLAAAAIFVPFFGDFMSLLGALANCGLIEYIF